MTESELDAEIVPSNQLQVFVKESGLSEPKARFLVENFEEHFKMSAEWAKKASKILVTDASQTVLMEEARTARLFLRKKRLEIENARVSLKEESLKEGKAIDRVANFLKNAIIPTEEHLSRQEDFVKLKKEAEDKRILDEAYARQEAERIAKEQADREARALLQAENEKLRKANEEADRKRREELAKIQKENEAKLAVEREKALTAEAELRAKKQEEMKNEADRIKKEEALLKADDSTKLIAFKKAVLAIQFPEVKSVENKRIIEDAKSHLYLAIVKIQINEEEE